LDRESKKEAKKYFRAQHNEYCEYSDDGGESMNSSSSSDLDVKQRYEDEIDEERVWVEGDILDSQE
jgi:hypothetical protein